MYEEQIHGRISVIDFSDLEQAAATGEPGRYRNHDWMVLGPFVMQTEGAFETEYLYQRHLILEPDYLMHDGGECGTVPYIGRRVKSDFLGGEEHVWSQGMNKWDCLRFDPDDGYSACDDALYLTEQRNCVFYAAVYVRCAGEKRAMICYENSGCRLFLNGCLISDEPYGRVKGVPTMGHQVPVQFRDGLNLLLFKLRPGYFCDTVDLSMSNCSIWPMTVCSGGLGVTCPSKTAVFTRADGCPKQVFPCFAVAFDQIPGGRVVLADGQAVELEPMEAGTCRLIRMEVAAGEQCRQVAVPVSVQETGGECIHGSVCVQVDPAPGFRGEEMVTTSFHFDTTYHQEQRIYAMGAIYITREILKEMRKDPRFKTIISEIDYLHPYYSLYPRDRAFLRQAFANGQTESDCFYNQPNELTSGAEGIVRNLLYGQLYHRDVMGRICHIYTPGDVFGHFNQMSQVSAKGGCDGVSWGKHIFGFAPAFHHVSPDGTHLLHQRGDVKRKAAEENDWLTCGYSSSVLSTVPGYFADGDLSWMEERQVNARFCVPSEFQAQMRQADEERYAEEGRPRPYALTSRDMSLYHAGVSLTRTDFKQANRMAENLLISAEKFSTIAALMGASYPEKALDKAWRQVLCGQHHDSITGTNNEVSFVDLMIEYREAVELAADILNHAVEYIASRVATPETCIPVVAFNPHTWQRQATVCVEVTLRQAPENYALLDSQGNVVPFRVETVENAGDEIRALLTFCADTPALGYSAYALTECAGNAQSDTVTVGTDTVIENAFFRIRVDPAKGGGIVSLYDKENDRELIDLTVDGPGNRILALKETHDRMETQHEFYTTGHRLSSERYRAEVRSEKCADYQKLTITYGLGNVTSVTQCITLNWNSRRIDFETRCDDYRDEDDLFCVTFPANLHGVRPIFDDRFAPQVRNESLNSMDFRTHQYAMFSHCAVYAANQWMDYGPSVTVRLGESDTVNLGMTQIIRRETSVAESLTERLLLALTKKAVPCTVFPDGKQSCVGSQIIHFNEDLTSDTRFVLAIAGDQNAYVEKLLAGMEAQLRQETDEMIAKQGYGVVFLRDRDNLWKKPIDVFLLLAKNEAALEKLVAAVEQNCAVGRFVDLPCLMAEHPGVTDDYGMALLNTGNIACSVERDGLLNLMLFHTAEFYGNIGKTNCGAKLVPERKSHVFAYSLYPHRESFREAQLYRRALERNDPLFAVTVKRNAAAELPGRKGFLETRGSAIVTAVKAGGAPMAAMRAQETTLAARGITVRCFEPDGIPGETQMDFGFKVGACMETNLLEEGTNEIPLSGQTAQVHLSPYEIRTLRLSPLDCAAPDGTKLGPQREIVEPTYLRSWEHDLGSMPMGYLSVAAVISRNAVAPDEMHIETEVSVANNYIDHAVTGSVWLELPEGWQANWTEMNYQVESADYAIFPVTFTKPEPTAKGIIRLHHVHDGQHFCDVFEVGYFDPTFSMAYDHHGLRAEVNNPTTQRLIGELWVASPIETWGAMDGKNPTGKVRISPYCVKVDLQPGEQKSYPFEVVGDGNLSWYAVGKLCINGRIHFSGVEKKGPRHCVWAHEFIDEIYQDGGSLEKLLKNGVRWKAIS